jgi:hypothetical protein
MNPSHFKALCVAAASALEVEALETGGRYSFAVDRVEAVLALDDPDDVGAISCYLDLGDAGRHDRAQVCEQLLELNLRNHGTRTGSYAFDIGTGRAIFCGHLLNADVLDGEYVADMLRLFVEQTEPARRMVANPATYTGPTSEDARSDLFMPGLA